MFILLTFIGFVAGTVVGGTAVKMEKPLVEEVKKETKNGTSKSCSIRR